MSGVAGRVLRLAVPRRRTGNHADGAAVPVAIVDESGTDLVTEAKGDEGTVDPDGGALNVNYGGIVNGNVDNVRLSRHDYNSGALGYHLLLGRIDEGASGTCADTEALHGVHHVGGLG